MSTWVCSCLIAMNDENVYDEFIYFTLQINSSSRFTVDNKYVRLAAKDWEFWILASVLALVLLSRHSFMALFLIKFQFWVSLFCNQHWELGVFGASPMILYCKKILWTLLDHILWGNETLWCDFMAKDKLLESTMAEKGKGSEISCYLELGELTGKTRSSNYYFSFGFFTVSIMSKRPTCNYDHSHGLNIGLVFKNMRNFFFF